MSSESSRPAGEPDAAFAEHRLHPLSWLFTLIGQMKQFALPLVVLLFTGRHSNTDLYGLIAVGALMLVSIAQYFTYRYRIDADGVVIRSGLLQRSLRHIPFARIQNVTLHQNPLHRLFNVAEVRLESAGAAKPEGQMRVLRMDAAQELERQIRQRAPDSDGVAPLAPPPERLLFSMPDSEVVLQGLVDNRGVLVVGGAFAFLAQAGDNLIGSVFSAVGQWLSGQASALHLSLLAMAGAALLLFLAAVLALRVFSVLIALLSFHGYRLAQSEGRLSVQRGLFTRLRASLPRHRIQAFSIREGLLHRLVGRRGLRVDTAVTEALNEDRSVRDLVPLARPDVLDSLLSELVPGHAWPVTDWHALHPRAWRRKFTVPSLLLVLVTSVLCALRGPAGLALLVLLPVLYWRSRVWAKYSAYSVSNGLVAFRGGWLSRHWRFAEAAKLQGLELLQSPFDRRHGMATLRFDTAGAGSSPALHIPYLPEAEARRIYALLSQRLASPPRAIIRSRIEASATPAR